MADFDLDALGTLAGTLAKAGAPVLGNILLGPAGGALASVIVGGLADALGTEPTPGAVTAAVAAPGNAERVAAFEKERSTDFDMLAAHLADTKDARATMVALAGGTGVVAAVAALTPPILTFVVTFGFFGALFLMMSRPLELSINHTVLLNVAVGGLQSAFLLVLGFWFGSTAGSRAKTDLIAGMASAAAAPAGRALGAAVTKGLKG